MRLIRQRCDVDCGLAVAAMLAGRSYAEACAADPAPLSTVGFSLREMVETLERLGVVARVSRGQYGVPIGRARFLHPGPVAVVIRPIGAEVGHWVCVDEGWVYDPERRSPVSLSAYGVRSRWPVLRQIRPTEA